MISHLAMIMDGNRRWAKKQGMFAWLGHRQGVKNVEMTIKYCINNKISYLSLYTFSLENLQNRPEQERSYIFLLIKESQSRIDEFIKNDVQIRFVGDLSKIPDDVHDMCMSMQQATSHCVTLVCNFLFCYGSQQEIIASVQKIVDDGEKKVTKELLKQNFWMDNIPDPEIIIRTGGVQRLSNFLLFQAAYSEIRFLDCLWPDLTCEILDQTIQNCMIAHKNFGK
ncbi:di-trans,poly-cis-decaprenylcistransferase [Candidatus Babeliales bacterium]|nr:di-trans,poly-cis-decaprenylcistransferase [Candidatus Babeliales bacterium]